MSKLAESIALLDKIKDAKLPGFYKDLNDSLCCMINNKLITVFINDCDETVDITIDECSIDGLFDQCIEWETIHDYKSAIETIKRFTLECNSF